MLGTRIRSLKASVVPRRATSCPSQSHPLPTPRVASTRSSAQPKNMARLSNSWEAAARLTRSQRQPPASQRNQPVGSQRAGIDERVKNAYDAAQRKLARQDQTLSNVRNRATSVLTAAVLIGSFAAGVGFLKPTTQKGQPAFPFWARLTLLIILAVIVVLYSAITWPMNDFYYGAGAKSVLWADEPPVREADWVQLVEELIEFGVDNDRRIKIRQVLYGFQSIALAVESFIIIASILRE